MKKKYQKTKKIQKNQGFSLIELIISITILAIIFAPLMGNFIQSMKLNRKAEKLQQESNLTASIQEGLEEFTMAETIDQFTNLLADFDIITEEGGFTNTKYLQVLSYDNINGYSLVSTLDKEKHEFKIIQDDKYKDLPNQEVYYFGIQDIEYNNVKYDALIKMDAKAYRPTGSDTMNSYPMPDAINLDVMANGLLFSNGEADADLIDQEALATYLAWGEAYALHLFEQSSAYQNYQAAYSQWLNECEEKRAVDPHAVLSDPPPAVTFHKDDYEDYCKDTTVKGKITKTMTINISQSTSNTIEYKIDYNCAWPSGSTLESSLSYPVCVNNYSGVLKNVYLFFRPSIFGSASDIVQINNATPANAINFYVARQSGAALLPKLTLKTNSVDNISIFTNLESLYLNLIKDGALLTGGYNNSIVKTEKKNRLYEVTVSVYKYVDTTDISAKYKEEIYTLKTTKEE